MLKHLLYFPVQVLDVLVGLVGKHAAGHASQTNIFVFASKRSTTSVPTV